MALSITPADGQQTTTQNPQTAPMQTIGASTQSGGVQPGTATSLLTDTQGESLGSTVLTTVSLGSDPQAVRTQASSSQPTASPTHHKLNAVWLSIPVILCLLAVAIFWVMTRSAKNTTD